MRRGFKADANRIAIRVRAKLGLLPTDPIDPVEICGVFGIDLIDMSDLDCDCSDFLGPENSCFSAVTVPRGFRTAIVHNGSHHPYRQRSNICHELAHCFLGHVCVPPLTSDGERSRDSGNEAEAHYLAGALLLTNEGALHILRSGLMPYAQGLYALASRCWIIGFGSVGQKQFFAE